MSYSDLLLNAKMIIPFANMTIPFSGLTVPCRDFLHKNRAWRRWASVVMSHMPAVTPFEIKIPNSLGPSDCINQNEYPLSGWSSKSGNFKLYLFLIFPEICPPQLSKFLVRKRQDCQMRSDICMMFQITIKALARFGASMRTIHESGSTGWYLWCFYENYSLT